VRHTELWARLEVALGPEMFKTWADYQAITDLDSRTVSEALAEGVPPKQIWAAVWAALELPEKDK
jgi:Protein of unknown function (DUF3046)